MNLTREELALRARSAPRWAVIALVAVSLFTWLAFQRDFGPEGFYVPLLGLVILLGGLAPGLRYLARLKRDPSSVEPLPYFPILGLIFGVMVIAQALCMIPFAASVRRVRE